MSKISDKTRKLYVLVGILFLLGNYSLGAIYGWYPSLEILLLVITAPSAIYLITMLKSGRIRSEKKIKHAKKLFVS